MFRTTLAAIALASVAALGLGGQVFAQDGGAATKTEKASFSMTGTEVVDGMQTFYDEAKTFSADFTQKFVDITGGDDKVSRGVVFFKKGGKMRWDYAKGDSNDEKFLISNGETFWSWEPAYNQYCAMDLSQATLPSALTFLAGEGDIKADFDVKVIGEDDKRIQIELTPKSANPNYEYLEFNIRKANFRVDVVTIHDALGNANSMYFKKAEFNGEMANSNFQFDPPTDANHICEGG